MKILNRLATDVGLMLRRPPRQQYAALCYRSSKKLREPEVLLLTSRDTGRWVIPKGWPMANKKAHAVAEQEAYEEAVTELFDALDYWDGALSKSRYLCGDRMTEADWFMFTTLVRFDAVYHGHFKCNLRRIEDYDHLSGYLRELYQVPGIAETVDIPHIKRHYYTSHESVNPTRIVPKGPILNLDAPHGRERLSA